MHSSLPARLLVAAALATSAVWLAAWPGGASAAVCARASSSPAQVSARSMVHSTLCLLNATRRRHGLHPLRMSRRLSTAARGHSRSMVRGRYFAHGSFVQRIRRAGYLRTARSWVVGENIAWGSGSRSSALATMRAWMHSPGHRENILNRSYRQIGIGIVLGAPNGMRFDAATYTTDFGVKR
jgi:uncharacterized protein YkwD